MRRSQVLLVVAGVLSVAVVLWSFVGEGLFGVLLSAELTPDEKLARLKGFFESFGYAAPFAYVVAVTIEVVVAPIPGVMLYAPGGVIFGGFWGGLLSLVGNVTGAAISCQLMRLLGRLIGDRFTDKPSLHALRSRIAGRGVLVIFLLRLNPLTSSDLVSYAAGLTPMPTWKLMVGTALGMAPLCWIQAYTADSLLSAFPHLLYPLAVLCGIYAVLVLYVVWRWARTNRNGADG